MTPKPEDFELNPRSLLTAAEKRVATGGWDTNEERRLLNTVAALCRRLIAVQDRLAKVAVHAEDVAEIGGNYAEAVLNMLHALGEKEGLSEPPEPS